MTAIALVCAVSLNAQAQYDQPGEVIELTLEEAIEIALNDNPTIRVAELEITRQDYVRRETLGNLYPSLSATGNYQYSVVKQEMAKGLSFGADNTIAATANLTLPLFAPAVYATLKLNRSQMESAVEAARSSKITLVNEVRKSYYNILLAEQSLEVLEASAITIQETVDNTEAMFATGLASEYDLLTAQVQLSNLQPTIIQTRNSIDVAKMLLKMYLSIPQEYDIKVRGSLDGFSEQILLDNAPRTTDVAYNSDLRNLDIQEQMLNQQIKLINTQRMPTIAAFGQATITGNDMEQFDLGSIIGGGSSSTSSNSKFWWQHPVTVGVQISVPIFSGNKNVNQVRQTRNTLNQLSLQREYLEQSVKMQAQNAINNIITAREKMTANEKTVAQAQKAYDISAARYKAGAGTILELNSAQLSLTQAQLNYSQAIYDYLAAEADYEKTIGIEYMPNN